LGRHYDDLEPALRYVRISLRHVGNGGQLAGQIQEGGNPFEGRVRGLILRPRKRSIQHTLFGKAAVSWLQAFPQPSGNLSKAYTNPLGVRLGRALLRFLRVVWLRNYSKASPQTTILPVLVRQSNFTRG